MSPGMSPAKDDDLMKDYCPHCGQYTGGDSVCPNCGGKIFDDSGLEEYEDEDDIGSGDEEKE
ncbi:MAG: zinc ribbon domain-containing protein [bacterium]|nr:zinc ribbon domain-containing protein [bacterium]